MECFYCGDIIKDKPDIGLKEFLNGKPYVTVSINADSPMIGPYSGDWYFHFGCGTIIIEKIRQIVLDHIDEKYRIQRSRKEER